MKGFTFVELIIVVGIIALLSTLAAVGIPYALKSSRDGVRANSMNDVRTALELYHLRNFQYPNIPNDFCGLLTTLTGGNYLSFQPKDPRTQTNLCSGPGDGNVTIGGAMYNYTATPAAGTAS